MQALSPGSIPTEQQVFIDRVTGTCNRSASTLLTEPKRNEACGTVSRLARVGRCPRCASRPRHAQPGLFYKRPPERPRRQLSYPLIADQG
jgi:hypothetical protein